MALKCLFRDADSVCQITGDECKKVDEDCPYFEELLLDEGSEPETGEGEDD